MSRGGLRAGAGRKPGTLVKQEHEKRTIRWMMRWSESEWSEIVLAANNNFKSVTEFVRGAALSRARCANTSQDDKHDISG